MAIIEIPNTAAKRAAVTKTRCGLCGALLGQRLIASENRIRDARALLDKHHADCRPATPMHSSEKTYAFALDEMLLRERTEDKRVRR